MEQQNMVRLNKRKSYAAIAGFLAGIALSGTAAMAETHHDRPDRATERGATAGNATSSGQTETPQRQIIRLIPRRRAVPRVMAEAITLAAGFPTGVPCLLAAAQLC